MSKTVIPEKTIVNCDSCGVECNGGMGRGARRMKGVLSFKGDALDYLGDPAANGSWSRDLCDHCVLELTEVMNARSTRIREAMQGDTSPSKEVDHE